MEMESQVLVFKTNICDEAGKIRVGQHLEKHHNIIDWSVDAEDIDKVLRVVAPADHTAVIMTAVRELGFECFELE